MGIVTHRMIGKLAPFTLRVRTLQAGASDAHSCVPGGMARSAPLDQRQLVWPAPVSDLIQGGAGSLHSTHRREKWTPQTTTIPGFGCTPVSGRVVGRSSGPALGALVETRTYTATLIVHLPREKGSVGWS